MKPKNIDLANKCGSCCWFEPIVGTCSGYCLRNKYGDDVICDPEHPYWQVARSRMKCKYHNSKPVTNADRIRAMSDDELAEFVILSPKMEFDVCSYCEYRNPTPTDDRGWCLHDCENRGYGVCLANAKAEALKKWLKQPYKEET